jgi:ParB family chromosome partitioning protein
MTARKTGLGKGLGALIPTDEGTPAAGVPTASTQGLIQVPLSSITPNPHQPRLPIREDDIRDLADSIREHGVIQPLVVALVGDGYQLIAGERRWRASRQAGLAQVPVVVKDVTPNEMLELALVENIQRSDLNPLEEAHAYQQLTEEFGLTQGQVAKRVGKSRTAITNTLRLLKAARHVQEALLEDRISEGHARALLGLEASEQDTALKTVLERSMSVRQIEELVSTFRMDQLAARVKSELLKGTIDAGHAQALAKLEKTAQQEAALRIVLSQSRSVPQAEQLVQSLLKPQGRTEPARPIPTEAEERKGQTKSLESEFRSALASEVSLSRNQQGAGRLIIRFESDEDLDRIYERIVGKQ